MAYDMHNARISNVESSLHVDKERDDTWGAQLTFIENTPYGT